MRRRDLVAGIGSLGVLAGAGSIVRYGPPSVGGDGEASDATGDDEDEDEEWPIEVETIDARGSEAGTLTVPSEDGAVMVLMFFVNGCGNCQVQTGRVADARAELEAEHGDDVRFLSLTYDSEDQIPPDDLREWWETHGGNGYVSYDASRPMQEYAAVGYPVTIVIDPDGEEHWRETGTTGGREIAAEVERVLEATADENDEAETEDPSDDETGDGADGDGAENDTDGDETDETDASENEGDADTA